MHSTTSRKKQSKNQYNYAKHFIAPAKESKKFSIQLCKALHSTSRKIMLEEILIQLCAKYLIYSTSRKKQKEKETKQKSLHAEHIKQTDQWSKVFYYIQEMALFECLTIDIECTTIIILLSVACDCKYQKLIVVSQVFHCSGITV